MNSTVDKFEKTAQNCLIKDSEKFLRITNTLKAILKEDSKQEKPLFLKINDDFIYSLLEKKIKKRNKSFVVSITGESASGKTTFVKNVVNTFSLFSNKKIYTTINCDDYYYDMSKELRDKGSYEALFASGYSFDTPDAINISLMKLHLQKLKAGEKIQSPSYDFVTCSSLSNGEIKESAELIFNEGLFTLHEELHDISDVKVYIHTPFELIKERWYKRAGIRGKTGKAADMQFENVNQSAAKYIRPTVEYADIVLNGEVTPNYISYMVTKIINSIKAILED